MITKPNNTIIETIDINNNILIDQKWKLYKIGWEHWSNETTGGFRSDFFCWVYYIELSLNKRFDYLITIFDKEAKLDDLKNSFVINYEVNCGEIRRKNNNFDNKLIHIFDYNEFFKCKQFTKEYQKWYFEVKQHLNLKQKTLF